MGDATTALIRAIRGNFVNFVNFVMTVERIRSRDWASGTFVGTRHELTFCLEGEAAEEAANGFLRDLEEAEFPLRGHILADIRLVSEERQAGADKPLVRLSLEALTVADL